MKRRYPLALLIFLLLAALAAWALTETRRATSDHASFESAGWQNTGASNCNTVNCWTEIDDGTGATCTTEPTDGDTTYISSATSAAKQGFGITTSLPTGASISNVQFNTCVRREGTTNSTDTLKLIHNSAEIGAGCTVAPTGTSYADVTCNYAVTETFGAGDTLGFTVLKAANTRIVRHTGIAMVVTYTLGGKKIKVTQSSLLTPPQTQGPVAPFRFDGGTR